MRLRILSVLVILTVAASCNQGSVARPTVAAPSDATLDKIAKVVRAADPSATSTSVDISVRGAPDGATGIKPVRARSWAGDNNQVSVIVESFRTPADAVRFDRTHTRANMTMYRSITRITPPVSGATAFTCGCGGDTMVTFLRGNTRIFIEVETPITDRVAVADRLARNIDHTLVSGARADARV